MTLCQNIYFDKIVILCLEKCYFRGDHSVSQGRLFKYGLRGLTDLDYIFGFVGNGNGQKMSKVDQ